MTASGIERVVAVIGTGSAGTRHLRALSQIPDVRVIAVPKRPERVGQLHALGYAAVERLGDARAQGARWCVVASNTGDHVDDACHAIKAGLEVLVEKPLASDAPEAHRILDVARDAGRTIHVACVLRFSKSLNLFRSRLAEIGRLHAVRVECQSYLPDWRPDRPYRNSYSASSEQGGVLRDLIHEIDYTGWIFGWPSALQASVRNLGRLAIDTDEAADLVWETQTGTSVSMRLDYLSKPPRRRVTAHGDLGTLEWDGVAHSVTVQGADAFPRCVSVAETRDEMFIEQDAAFLKSSAERRTGELTTGREGFLSLAVCDAARRASESRSEERIAYE